MKTPRPEYPNPQFERTNWINLNGEWDFEIDNSRSGVERGILDRPLASKIVVPFCPESTLSGIGNTDYMLSVFYRRTFKVKAGDLKGNRVFFHVGACDFDTTVWINKKEVGRHAGGYTPFAFDITDYVVKGDNTVDIRADDDTLSRRQATGKQSLRYASHGCEYTRTTGIWQTVWLEIVPENHVKNFKIYPSVENTSVTINFELSGKAPLSVRAFYDSKEVGKASIDCADYTASLTIPLSEKHLWELGCGRLYELEITFGDDIVSSYFGLRSISLDKVFKLNGTPVFQRLVLDQGFYPDGIYTAKNDATLVRDIELSMNVGFNGARLHQKVFEPRFLYHCDRLGYMVWGEYPNWGLGHSDPACLETFVPEWLEELNRDFNHPSIIGWCPFNETWNYPPHYATQINEVLKIAYEVTKAVDPTRPCIDTSGNYHVKTDIYDTHDYEQDVEVYKARYKKFSDEGELYDRYHERQHWRGEPVFISEYGGIGIHIAEKTDTAWCYGNAAKSFEEFYERYAGLTDALLDCERLIGFCYTQLTDVEQEKNGLYTYERKPKFDCERLKKINSRKAAIEK